MNSPCFRIYYCLSTGTLTERCEAANLARAVRRAEARCAAATDQLRYFEIWQDANLLFASNNQARSEPAPAGSQAGSERLSGARWN